MLKCVPRHRDLSKFSKYKCCIHNGHTQVDMKLLMIIYQWSLLEWSYTSGYEITDDNISMEFVGMVIHKWI